MGVGASERAAREPDESTAASERSKLSLQQKIDRTFRAYDVRGVYGDDLDLEIARRLGYGIGRYLARQGEGVSASPGRGELAGADKGEVVEPRTVAICRDVRLSSQALAAALADGLTGAGLDVLDLGEGPTPLLYYAAKRGGVAGAVMVTGSHNPPEQNGFKVWLGAGNVFGEELAEIGRMAMESEPSAREPAGVPRVGSVNVVDLGGEYASEVVGSVREGLPDTATKPAGRSDTRPLKVAVDCGNGTAGPLVVPLLEELGCEVVGLATEPDGNFPNHHPDPTVPAYLADLRDAVIKNECDLGIAFDGDADRLGALDGEGRIVFADRLLYLFGAEIAEAAPGAKVIGDVKCSDVVFDGLAEAGAKPIVSRTGHSFIKQRLRDEDAVLAGEMSGHFFFADRYLGYDDAIYAACRLCALLAGTGKTLAEALSALPVTSSTPELRLECAEERKQPVLDALERIIDGDIQTAGAGDRARAADDTGSDTPPSQRGPRATNGGPRRISKIDGLRLSFDDGWCLVRKSNTEAILVLRFEGLTEQALHRIEGYFLARLTEAAPELEAPLRELLEVCA